jgi:ketosteroid isomerase-like protein
VYARGGFELRYWYMDEDTRHEVTNKGNSLMLLRREADGQWRISHHMWGDPE